MDYIYMKSLARVGRRLGAAVVTLALVGCADQAAPPRVVGAGEVFTTPEQAVEALVAANRAGDPGTIGRILGPSASELISSGDPVADKAGEQKFVAAYDAQHALETESDDKAILIVGQNHWPLPIPIVRVAENAWQFDTAAGRQEILDRRVGRNESTVIDICRTYVVAQRDYAQLQMRRNGIAHFAQHIISTKGKKDGLYWPTKPGQPESPLGPMIAGAEAEGYHPGKKTDGPKPFHGYIFRLLKGQGAHAPGGAQSYMAGGHLTKGYGLIAVPAKYGDSGIMTFIVNQTGIVFEKNLGPDSLKAAAQLTVYDPDDSWHIAAP